MFPLIFRKCGIAGSGLNSYPSPVTLDIFAKGKKSPVAPPQPPKQPLGKSAEDGNALGPCRPKSRQQPNVGLSHKNFLEVCSGELPNSIPGKVEEKLASSLPGDFFVLGSCQSEAGGQRGVHLPTLFPVTIEVSSSAPPWRHFPPPSAPIRGTFGRT